MREAQGAGHRRPWYMTELDVAQLFVQAFAQPKTQQKGYVEAALAKMSTRSILEQAADLRALTRWVTDYVYRRRLEDIDGQDVLKGCD